MASYHARLKELSDRLQQSRPKLSPDEATRIEGVIGKLDQQRDALLSALADAAGDEGDDKMADKFKEAYEEGREQIDELLEQMLDGLPSPQSNEAVCFRNRAIIEELRFWDGLAGLGLGEAHDKLQALGETVEWEIQTLTIKWNDISGPDLALLQAEIDATRKANDILKDGIAKAGPMYLAIGRSTADANDWIRGIAKKVNAKAKEVLLQYMIPEELADFLTTMGRPGKEAIDIAEMEHGMPPGESAAGLVVHVGDDTFRMMDPGAWTADTLKVAIKAAAVALHMDPDAVSMGTALLGKISDAIKEASFTIREQYYQQVQQYKNILPNQDAVLVAFSTTRHEADDFIKKNNFDAASKVFDQIKDGLDHWASAPATPGLGADATAFAFDVREALSRRMGKLDQQFRDLFTQHADKFLGPVSDAVKQSLLQSETWHELQVGMIGLGLPARLVQWRDNVVTIQPQLADGLKELQANLAGLPVDLGFQFQQEYSDWQSKLQDQLQKVSDDAKQMQQECTKVVADEQILRDYGRDALLARLLT